MRRFNDLTAHDDKNIRGYSLLELLIALMIMALAAVIVTATINQSGETRAIRQITVTLVDNMKQARSRAEWTGNSQEIRFNASDRTFRTSLGHSIQIPTTVRVEFTTSEQEGLARVRFDPDGSSSGGKIILAGPRSKSTITIDWLTSHVDQQLEKSNS